MILKKRLVRICPLITWSGNEWKRNKRELTVLGMLEERIAMSNQGYLLKVDSYLKRIEEILETDDREEIEYLASETDFAEIGWTPYFLEQIFCLVQLEYEKVTLNIIDGFRSIYGKQVEYLGNTSFSEKQWIIILKQLEKYLNSSEEDYHYFLLKNERAAEKSRIWQSEVLYNHDRLTMFQTDLFQTLDYYYIHFSKGYETLVELIKHDSDLSCYRTDGTITAWIYNSVSIINHFGFVLDRLDAQQMYGVLQLYDVTEDDFFSREKMPELLKKAQQDTIWKKLRLWYWKRKQFTSNRLKVE